MARKLFWLIVVMLGFGLIVLSSASVVQAQKQFGSSSYYWRHQLIFGILPGLAMLWLLWRVDYRRWRSFALPGLFCALVLMILVFVPSFGVHLKGATSWLSLGVFTFQPAEVLKLALVVYLAAWLGERGDRLKHVRFGLVPFVLVMGFVAVLLLLQPDLGTLGIVSLLSGGMYFIAGAPLKQVFGVVAAVVILMGGMAALSPERWSRITTVFNPGADMRGAGWQLNQSLIAIGSGGMWGVGLGQSTQKLYGFIPEPIGDSIFAVLVEELGWAGGMFTISLFAIFAIMMTQIARRARDGFGSLLVLGMCLWVMIQATVNMAAVTGLGPLTGIPLPFISYGGTSMVAMLAGLGIVLNVAERT
ncbi:MAG: cell division protein FtsW [Candidatus Yanofskybacteria bacterium]|nr:cell division protein FtsW [Candidatus Yanofskybacteria bacterium]